MITGLEILGPGPRRAIGYDEFVRSFVTNPELQAEGTLGRFAGEVIVDPAGTWLTLEVDGAAIGERRLSVRGEATAFTDRGKAILAGSDQATITRVDGTRTINLLSGSWFEDVPYRNVNAGTNKVFIGTARVPVDVAVTGLNAKIYASYTDLPGFVITPDSVSTTGSRLTFSIDAALTALGVGYWTTADRMNTNQSMAAIVWLDDTQTGVEVKSADPDVAIVAVRLMKAASGNAWTCRTPVGSTLGQTVPSTTPAHYKIAILGQLVTTTDLTADPDWVYVGEVTSATGSETFNYTGQVRSLPYGQIAASISTFTEEHYDTNGTHKSVTADTVESRGTGALKQVYYSLGNAAAGVRRYTMVELDKLPRARGTTAYGAVTAWWEWDETQRAYRMRWSVAKGQTDTPTVASSITWYHRINVLDSDLEGSIGNTPETRAYIQALSVTAAIYGTPTVKEGFSVQLVRRRFSFTGDWATSPTALYKVDGTTPGGTWNSGASFTRVTDWVADDDANYGASSADMVEADMNTWSASGAHQYVLAITWTMGDTVSLNATLQNEVEGTMLVREIGLQYRLVTAER